MTGQPVLDDNERIVGHIEVFRIISMDGGMRDVIVTDDGNGEELDLVTAVGMLAVSQHIMLTDPE